MSTSMDIVNRGLVLASTCWSAVVWKWIVSAAGEGLTAHALYRALLEVRFTHLNPIPLDILAKRPIDVLLWVHSEDDPAHASAAGDPK
jgi:hypothetical protein